MKKKEKENEEDKEEITWINETDEQAATGLDKYADHNIEEATIFAEVWICYKEQG